MNAQGRLSRLLVELQSDRTLYVTDNWRRRLDALDRLESCLIHEDAEADRAMLDQVSKIGAELEASNRDFYESLRRDIRAGSGAHRLMQCTHEADHDEKNAGRAGSERYDDLDVLVSGVLQLDEPHDVSAELAPDMVFYQPTPATQIFQFISRTGLNEQDVLVDLGAGLGHVPLLAAICSSARCIGIECEPAYVASARKSASDLRLNNATFLAQDVRDADFSQGTLFYLYTPFTGTLLHEVMSMLRHEAAQREIRIGTLGPCTEVVAQESWLQTDDTMTPHEIVIFRNG
ncbi:class I SAM-dependent methyltransferase [Dyella dinghuensis]|uniref:Class I SAM-dependent methyltransferase n=1 Tax=Dyella dinghuensis TaxID=1920169 RepID=A0A432LV35_9GAMM|nr:class I SAM-dependent methyltransferase [Dyella dinghuensis]RUL64516.1 class I SAM-dependent methyltransferase [Dyella dinghuensis]